MSCVERVILLFVCVCMCVCVCVCVCVVGVYNIGQKGMLLFDSIPTGMFILLVFSFSFVFFPSLPLFPPFCLRPFSLQLSYWLDLILVKFAICVVFLLTEDYCLGWISWQAVRGGYGWA